MTEKRTRKRNLIVSAIATLVCLITLVGSTLAWFTDEAKSGDNKIVSGTLDVELSMWDGNDYTEISSETAPIFGAGSVAQNNNAATVWEPGKTQIAYLAVENKGSLDIKYSVSLNVTNCEKNLCDTMRYAVTPDAQNGDISGWNGGSTVVSGTQTISESKSLKAGKTAYFALSMHMDEGAGNEYQGGKISFDISVLATQLNAEVDAFGSDYDKDASFPAISESELTKALENGGYVVLGADISTTAPIKVQGTLNGGGKTVDATAVNTQTYGNYAIIPEGGTVENITILNAWRSIGSINTNEDIFIRNVTIDNTTYAINGNGNGSASVFVSDSNINGWISYSDVETLSFENCRLGKGNSYDGYLVVYGDTSFSNCTFEEFTIGARKDNGGVVAAGDAVTFTNCSYITSKGTVKVTSDNFASLFEAQDDADFANLKECKVIVDGVEVDWK